MTIEEIREKLKDRNIKMVAANIGVHFNTLHRIARGDGNPNYSTLKKLEDYLNG